MPAGVGVTPCQVRIVPLSSRVPALAWPLTNPLTLGALVDFSVPQFPWLSKGVSNAASP